MAFTSHCSRKMIGAGLDDAMAGWVLVVGILGVTFLGVVLASRPRHR